MEKVSIVIPFYNCKHLPKAIESALNQTYPHCEVIVVDDGSKPVYSRLVKPYLNRINYIRKENGGTASALNVGIKKMTGDYFAWLSSDDLFLPEKIEKQLEFMRTHDHFITYGNYQLINETDIVHKESQGISTGDPVDLIRKMLKGCIINGSTIIARKEIFQQVGLFDESLKYAQDYEMWLRILCRYHIGYHPTPLGKYRVHPKMGSQSLEYDKYVHEEIQMIKKLHRANLLDRRIDLKLQKIELPKM